MEDELRPRVRQLMTARRGLLPDGHRSSAHKVAMRIRVRAVIIRAINHAVLVGGPADVCRATTTQRQSGTNQNQLSFHKISSLATSLKCAPMAQSSMEPSPANGLGRASTEPILTPPRNGGFATRRSQQPGNLQNLHGSGAKRHRTVALQNAGANSYTLGFTFSNSGCVALTVSAKRMHTFPSRTSVAHVFRSALAGPFTALPVRTSKRDRCQGHSTSQP